MRETCRDATADRSQRPIYPALPASKAPVAHSRLLFPRLGTGSIASPVYFSTTPATAACILIRRSRSAPCGGCRGGSTQRRLPFVLQDVPLQPCDSFLQRVGLRRQRAIFRRPPVRFFEPGLQFFEFGFEGYQFVFFVLHDFVFTEITPHSIHLLLIIECSPQRYTP